MYLTVRHAKSGLHVTQSEHALLRYHDPFAIYCPVYRKRASQLNGAGEPLNALSNPPALFTERALRPL